MEVEVQAIEQAENEDICVNVEESEDMEKVVVFEQENVDILDNSMTTTDHIVPAVAYEPIVPDITMFSYDVQHGYRVYCELLSDQYKAMTRPFLEPVDVEALGLWDYYTRIENPMSFRQIESKFKSYLYQSITEVISDLRLILENCYRYNGSDHWVSKQAQKLENILDQKLALLNRSLRDKVTLQATMAFRSNKTITFDNDETDGRRRRSGRTSYGGHSDRTSRLVNHLLLQEEETQKGLKRQKEKEKKEAYDALMVQLGEWENEIFTSKTLNELHSVWEIPSIGSFLWLFQEALNLPELNYSEFESGLIIPHKSQLMAAIFSALLSTPNQRKTIHKRTPMRFTTWQKKLKDKMDSWYMTREAGEFKLVAHQIGREFFQILGNANPLEKCSYIDLTLHQRVLILKALCDECLDYDHLLRDYLGNADTTPFREIILGNDGDNYSYVYFPIFETTDIRIYKQAALPSITEWYKKWKTSYGSSSDWLNQTCVSQSGSSRKSRTRQKSGSKSKRPITSIPEGFELVCYDVESLRDLCTKFADNDTTPSGKKRRGRPPRKQCEKALHRELVSLLDELTVSEARYAKARTKGMMNLMKDWKTEDPPDDPDDPATQNENEAQEDVDAFCKSDTSSLERGELKDTYQDSPLSAAAVAAGPVSLMDLGEQGNSMGRVTRSKLRNRNFYDSPTPSPKTPENPTEDHISGNNSIPEKSVNSVSTNVVSENVKTNDVILEEPQPECAKGDDIIDEVSKNNTVSEKSDTAKVGECFKGSQSVDSNVVSENCSLVCTMDAGSEMCCVDEQSNCTGLSNPATISNENLSSSTNLSNSGNLAARNRTEGTRNGGVLHVTNMEVQDSNGTQGSSENVPITDEKENRVNTKDKCGTRGNKDCLVVNGDASENTNLTCVDGELGHRGKNGNVVDREGTEMVQQNGEKKSHNACNNDPTDDYEPGKKRHCSADNHITVTLGTDGRLVVSQNLGASHQSLSTLTKVSYDTEINCALNTDSSVTSADSSVVKRPDNALLHIHSSVTKPGK